MKIKNKKLIIRLIKIKIFLEKGKKIERKHEELSEITLKKDLNLQKTIKNQTENDSLHSFLAKIRLKNFNNQVRLEVFLD